jgi:hypothetical protein
MYFFVLGEGNVAVLDELTVGRRSGLLLKKAQPGKFVQKSCQYGAKFRLPVLLATKM